MPQDRLQATIDRLIADYSPSLRESASKPKKGRTLLDISRDLGNEDIPFDAAISDKRAQEIPLARTPQLPPMSRPPMETATPPRPYSADLEDQLNALDAGPSRKNSLLQAAMQAGAIGLGSAFGGSVGGSGVAGAVNDVNERQAANRTQRRKSLMEQVEAQKQREYQTGRDAATDARADRSRAQDQAQFEAEQTARTTEANADRTYRTQERVGSQDFTAGQNREDRAYRTGESQAERVFRTGERIGSQDFTAGQNTQDRDFRQGESTLERNLRMREGSLDRGSRERIAGEKTAGSGQANANASSAIDDALSTISVLKNSAGKSGAVGAKGATSLYGILDKPMGGTESSDFAAYFDALKAQLVLPKLQMLRGLGAMSDREFATLSSAATALNRDMTEESFDRELSKIEQSLASTKERLAQGGGGSAPIIQRNKTTGQYRYSTDGGKTWQAGHPR